jgi:hypothetical protein
VSRVVHVPGKGVARERDLPGGIVRREYVDAGWRVAVKEDAAPTLSDRPRSKAEQRLPLFLKSLSASYQVSLSPSAALTIRQEIRTTEVAFGFEPMEVGGWLLSDKRWPDRITVATRPGEDARYGRSTVSLGTEQLDAVEQAYPHLSVRGDWHLHAASNDELPSEIDRRAWAKALGLTGDYWVSIIALPARTGWEQPALHGWITTESFTERLRLVEL